MVEGPKNFQVDEKANSISILSIRTLQINKNSLKHGQNKIYIEIGDEKI